MTQRLAEATQLMAEEKWLVETLNKIKNQRNSLQIEKLQLEGMKAAIQCKYSGNSKTQETPQPSEPAEVLQISPMNIMQAPSTNRTNFEQLPEVDKLCNTEQLNLNISHRSLNLDMQIGDDNMEEFEEDDNMIVDINMLMNNRRCNETDQ